MTQAPYGDKFRVVLRHTFQMLSASTTRYTVRFAMVYLSSVNGMIKKIIQNGVKDGMEKATQKNTEMLKKRMTVMPYTTTVARPPSAEPVAVPVRPEVGLSMLQSVFGTQLVDALEPWASLVHAMLAHLPLLGGLTMPMVLGALCTMAMLGALRVGLAVLRFFESAGKNPEDVFAWAAHHCFRVSARKKEKERETYLFFVIK